MIVVSSRNLEKFVWQVRALLPHLEATPMLLAHRHVGDYLIGLGTLGYLYDALNTVLEIVVEGEKMAGDLGLRDYSLVVGPESSYITTTPLPEVVPPLPKLEEATPLSLRDVRLNSMGCPEVVPGMVRFCVGDVEFAYYLK